MEATKQSNYEIMYIVDDQKPELVASIKKEFIEILTKNNGKVNKEEDFVRQFAYEINHKVQGHYFIMEVLTTSTNIANFDRVFSIKQKQGEVIRKLVINLDEEKINTFKQRKERPEPVYNRDSRENREFKPRKPYNPENKEQNDGRTKPNYNNRFNKDTKPNSEVSEKSSETK